MFTSLSISSIASSSMSSSSSASSYPRLLSRGWAGRGLPKKSMCIPSFSYSSFLFYSSILFISSTIAFISFSASLLLYFRASTCWLCYEIACWWTGFATAGAGAEETYYYFYSVEAVPWFCWTEAYAWTGGAAGIIGLTSIALAAAFSSTSDLSWVSSSCFFFFSSFRID